MRPPLCFRLAALLLLIFAAGHTAGFLTYRPPSAEGIAVLRSMQTVHLDADPHSRTYADFYTGFGLFITGLQLFLAWLAWWLGSVWQQAPRACITLGWSLALLHLVEFALALRFFGPIQAVFSALPIVLFALAAIAVRRSSPA